MALFTESETRSRAKQYSQLYKSVDSLLTEKLRKQASVTQHDIFLSHAYRDKEIVIGLALLIEDLGYTVYIDWRDDPLLDREKVTVETAETLKGRMRKSKSLLYSVTPSATDSVWMKWELGYKDGNNNRAAILPVSTISTDDYKGQQFLGLYPYVSGGTGRFDGRSRLWIHRSRTCYIDFDSWLSGSEPKEHS